MKNANDPGFGLLGAFDHARLQPGVVVAMHQHRNDEIFSYMRRGTMLHEDTSGARLPLTPTHVAVMNAGSGMWHEERVPDDGEPVEMLQIFVRPREDELPPNFQSREFPQAESLNAWRLLVGPEGGWTADELKMAERAGATICSFGVHVMRVETAAVVGAGIVLEAVRRLTR